MRSLSVRPTRTLGFRLPEKPASPAARALFLLATVLLDAAVANLSVLAAFLVRFEGALPERNFLAYRHLWALNTAGLVGACYLVGLYMRRRELARVELASMVVRASGLWLFFCLAHAYLRRDVASAYPTAVLFLSAGFFATLSFGVRAAVEELRRYYIDASHRVRRAVVVGNTPEGRRLLDAARADPRFEYRFAGVVDDHLPGGATVAGFHVLGKIPEIARVVGDEGIEEVVLAQAGLPHPELLHLLVQCAGLDVRFKVVPSLLEIVLARGRVKLVAGVPLMDLFGDEIPTAREISKRILDVLSALIGLALSLPLWPAIAAAVKLSSPGRVFFRQERVGLHGRSFHVVKFRTMRSDAEAASGPVLARPGDPRVTRVGAFLRRSRLDELPQLANVLLGEMSLVGPRPERPHFVRQFLKSVPEYSQRYRVRPGLTGLAQVEGEYDTSPRNKVRYDLIYINSRSLMLDLKIIAKTASVVFRGSGA